MDWFERLTGFREGAYEATRARLQVRDGRLLGDRSAAVGRFSLPSLAKLRAAAPPRQGRSRLGIVEGDVRAMHLRPENRGALFQVASQFNMLEMIGPHVSPENGVTRYEHDRTQGPACAMAAGAATVFRNYLVPCGGSTGQTAERQLDGLADLGTELAPRLGLAEAPWTMRNGYALPTATELAAVDGALRDATPGERDVLRGLLRVGLHEDVEVTDGSRPGPVVNQIFCSALPVSYSGLPGAAWSSFATLVLEAAYEATLLAASRIAAGGGSGRVLLTRLGGGAFGNDDAWIDAAMERALALAGGLDVVIVSYGSATASLRDLVRRCAA